NKDVIGKPLAQMTAPASTVMNFEIQNNFAADPTNPLENNSGVGLAIGSPLSNQVGNSAKYATGLFPGRNYTATPNPVHNDGSNFIACDGHVKFLKPGRISSGQNPSGPDVVQDETDTTKCPTSPCATGTGAMNNGGGNGSATLTFSLI
ncbi:MAG: hypothetical protein JWQ02_4333, partial [Capsulimonas sp.]|nr:hypothetical protein [Capsulimonas sp.]